MAAEMGAFAGHLLVVGGRAVRMSPPGALVERAPRRAARAREGDTFGILITPAAGAHAPAGHWEKLAQLAADVYFGSGGGVTAGLREALGAVHAAIQDEPGDPAPAYALALALRGAEVYAARAGRTFAVVRQGSELAVFPNDRSDRLIGNLPPLGVGAAPELQLARYGVTPGAAMLLADASLLDADDDALDAALSRGEIPAMLEQIKALAGLELAVSLLQFVAPGTPDPAGLAVQPGTRTPRETSARPSRAPTPPLAAPAPAAPPPAPTPAQEPIASGAAVEVTPAPQAAPPTAPPISPEATPLGERAEAPIEAEEPGLAQGARERVASLTGGLAARMPRVRRAEGEVEEGEEAARGPSALVEARQQAGQVGRGALRTVLSALLALVDGAAALLDRVLPEPDEQGRQGIPTNVAIGLAVLIPIVIVVVAMGLALAGHEKSDFETYLDRAKAAHAEAMGLANGACNNLTLRPLWSETLHLAGQAAALRPNDGEALVIQADAQNYLDCYDAVERRDLTLLREYAVGAELVGPVIHGGMDLYTLDRSRGMIYHDTLNETGSALITSDKDPIIWRGQVVSSGAGTYTVGDMFDINWLAAGGAAHDNVLIALDRSGLLIAYSPTFFTTAQQLITEERWRDPVALAVFRSNLYVLDRGANQIWRYMQPAGQRAYSSAPEEYFNADPLPDLSGAVDLGIDDNGAIYVLFADGSLKKFRRNQQGVAEEQPFIYKGHPAGALTSAQALFVDNDPASSSLYVLDPAASTIYEVSWAGTYHNGFRPRGVPDAFANLQGFYADSVVRNNMYVLAGNRLYRFARNP